MSEKVCPVTKEPCMEHKCVWYEVMYDQEIDAFGQGITSSKPTPIFKCAMLWPMVQLSEIQKRLFTNAATVQALRNDIASTAEVVFKAMGALPPPPVSTGNSSKPPELPSA